MLRQSSIDRRQAASYYTPASLTRLLVEEVLRERLKDLGPEDAEEILRLSICEPAMGGGAFLMEAVDQLAHRYLDLTQQRTGTALDPQAYRDEHGRVKQALARGNVYGVDLNPTAVRQGRIALGLDSDSTEGLRLCVGNSLIGARRAVWSADQLAAGRHAERGGDVPQLLRPSESRKDDQVYHFLVWDTDMLPVVQSRQARALWPDEYRRAAAWLRNQVRPAWTSEELREAFAICAQIDRLWKQGGREPLKRLMDAWCAFWFWPLEHAGELPDRMTWLAAARRLLLVDPSDVSSPWLATAEQLAAEESFFHWELAFSGVLGPASAHDGFDLVVGNPPWWKVFQPDQMDDAGQVRRLMGTTAVLKSRRLYPELAGIQTNLYKNFILLAWQLLGEQGVGGLLHQENAFDDPQGGVFRAAYYARLLAHLQFKNERMLFADVGHPEAFSINIFRGRAAEPCFASLSNLFDPATVAACRNPESHAGPVPSVRTEDGDWETRGHGHRMITITRHELALFARLFEDRSTPILQTRLPQVHSREILSVLDVLDGAERRLGDMPDAFRGTVLFDEAYAPRDGLITRQDTPSFQPREPAEWIVSGPHFAVGTPLAKTARSRCTEKNHYDPIDLTEILADYLPRAVFRPGDARGDRQAFEAAIGRWQQGELPLLGGYRHAHRRRGNPGVERTLLSCILPPGCTHIDSVYSIAFTDVHRLLAYSGASLSIVFDFLVRLTGKTDLRADVSCMLPLVGGPWTAPLVHRALRLNCLTSHYSPLWVEAAGESIGQDAWTSEDPRLSHVYELPWNKLDPHRWAWKTPLRSDFARRQALLEIDVLVALALGLSLDELLTIYRVQFGVMRAYEMVDEYDALGRHLPNTLRRNPGAKELLRARRGSSRDAPLHVSWPADGGKEVVCKTFHPPIIGVAREADYAQAYAQFRQRFGVNAHSPFRRKPR